MNIMSKIARIDILLESLTAIQPVTALNTFLIHTLPFNE
jgi:hypothetical protein